MGGSALCRSDSRDWPEKTKKEASAKLRRAKHDLQRIQGALEKENQQLRRDIKHNKSREALTLRKMAIGLVRVNCCIDVVIAMQSKLQAVLQELPMMRTTIQIDNTMKS